VTPSSLPPALSSIYLDQIVKTDHPHDKRVGRPPGDAYASVHAIQKDGLHSPRPFPRQELFSRTIEVEKKYVGAGVKLPSGSNTGAPGGSAHSSALFKRSTAPLGCPRRTP